ncbi:uncharacterized protein [Chlorocebus sabaeus]
MSSHKQKQPFTSPPQLQQQQVKQHSQPPHQESFVPITKEPGYPKVPQPGNTKIPELGCTKVPEPIYTKVPGLHPSTVTSGPAQQKTKQKQCGRHTCRLVPWVNNILLRVAVQMISITQVVSTVPDSMSSQQQKQPCTPPPQLQQQQVKQPCQPPPQEPCIPKTKEPCLPKVPEPCHPKVPEPCQPKVPEPCHPKVPEPCPSTVTPAPAQQKTKQK